MKTIIVAAGVSMLLALFGTPLAIKLFARRGYGQLIREEGPAAHLTKRGTPTMGGAVIVVATLIGYLVGHMVTDDPISSSGLLVLGLMTGLGLVGFIDDFIKIYKQTSLGLRSGAKLAGQAVVGALFALEVLQHPDGYDLTPADAHLSFLRDFGPAIGMLPFVLWIVIIIAGTSNAVNLTDGLDGLATGATCLVLAAYVLIGIWQERNDCTNFLASTCYAVRDPLDMAVVAAALLGRLLRVPVVERAAGPDLHGRHRLAGPGRGAGRAGRLHQDPAAAVHPGRAVRDHHAVGDHPGRLLQDDPKTGLPDGPAAASLRAARLGRDHDRDQVLDDRGPVRRPGPGHLLRGVAARLAAAG